MEFTLAFDIASRAALRAADLPKQLSWPAEAARPVPGDKLTISLALGPAGSASFVIDAIEHVIKPSAESLSNLYASSSASASVQVSQTLRLRLVV